MRLLPLFLALFLVIGGALAASAPLNKDVNTPIKTDTSSVNRLGWISIQTIPAAESSDDDQICAAFKNQFNATTKFVLTTASSKFLAQPDVPRNIIVTMNATATCAMKLTGTDISRNSHHRESHLGRRIRYQGQHQGIQDGDQDRCYRIRHHRSRQNRNW